MRDVNDTGFHLVLGRHDWQRQFGVEGSPPAPGDDPPSVVYDDQARSVTLRAEIDRFPRQETVPALDETDRTSADRDQYGSWYWIDPDDRTHIVVRNAGDGVVETFWDGDAGASTVEDAGSTPSPFQPADPGPAPGPQPLESLTITSDHRLVVAVRNPARLLIFDLHAGGPPTRLRWMHTDFAPSVLSARPNGGVYLLETPTDADPRLWVLDRIFRLVGPEGPAPAPPIFHPTDEHSPESPSSTSDAPPEPIGLPDEGTLLTTETLPDDSVLVLFVTTDSEGQPISRIRRFRVCDLESKPPVSAGEIVLDELLEPSDPTNGTADWAEWQAFDLAFAPEAPYPTEAFRGHLYVVGADGNQAYSLSISGDATGMDASVVPDYLPLRHFRGKGLVEAGGSVYYDSDQAWVPLTAQRRPRYTEQGEIRSAPFDSELTGCTWHRLFIDGCLPPDTTVRVESRASDRVDRLSDLPWQSEPSLYQRDQGSELPYYEQSSADAPDGSGTWELLLQHAEGRYLQLRLILEGNGRATPSLHALRVYAPRFSYLDEYMPDLYQENPDSASFVERFLANAEGMLTAMEGRIAAVKTLFDVRTVPDEYLDWLATWFGTSFDPALDNRRKRLFLDHAVELFNQRGTPAGLARMLTLVLDPCADETLFTPAGVAGAIGRPSDASDRTARQTGVRLVEQFAARGVPLAVVGDATVPEQPVEARADAPWTPDQGADSLHRRFRTFLANERYVDLEHQTDVWGAMPDFPPLQPDDPRRKADWDIFVRRVIDGPYAAIPVEEARSEDVSVNSAMKRFRAFLDRRYRRIEAVPAALADGAGEISDVTLPSSVPTGPALQDWMDFVGAALPIARAAHQFRVLVPVEPNAPLGEQQERLAVARRVVEEQKPAHTAFEVLPYWAAFRVGAVRTGLDTVLGRGSRYSSLLVGEGRLAQNTVGAAHPTDQSSRRVAGRDPAAADRPL